MQASLALISTCWWQHMEHRYSTRKFIEARPFLRAKKPRLARVRLKHAVERVDSKPRLNGRLRRLRSR